MCVFCMEERVVQGSACLTMGALSMKQNRRGKILGILPPWFYLKDLAEAPFAHDSLDPQLLRRKRLGDNSEPGEAEERGAERRIASNPPDGGAAVP